ncbi:MAG: NAD(+) kinase, partial [Gammaproteobacteria bacterium]|nr:NAD(+) kinase [Gammaproteobacteria bacterium]
LYYRDMFEKIALITNNDATEIVDTLQTVTNYLSSRDIELILDENCAKLLPNSGFRELDLEQLSQECDLAIVIGGDGTMLRAGRVLAEHDVPLLGINRGRLGFLTDIPADSVESHLSEILDGKHFIAERFLLQCQVERDGKNIMERDAFNEVIIQKWNIAKLIELETYVNETLVHSQRADGMIVATPTGSTAYALSGGGPILHPALDALVLVPICPHSLSNRPIVIDGNSIVEIVVGTPEIDHARLSCDGEISSELTAGDRVRIQKKDKKVRLVHPAKHNHFNTLRKKLHWG